MEFRITTHTGYGAPADAIESLWPHLQAAGVENGVFAKGHDEIRANRGHNEASRAIREEHMDGERRAILEAVCEVCDRTAELESDWYAIGLVD
jgi:hypothetical protein